MSKFIVIDEIDETSIRTISLIDELESYGKLSNHIRKHPNAKSIRLWETTDKNAWYLCFIEVDGSFNSFNHLQPNYVGPTYQTFDDLIQATKHCVESVRKSYDNKIDTLIGRRDDIIAKLADNCPEFKEEEEIDESTLADFPPNVPVKNDVVEFDLIHITGTKNTFFNIDLIDSKVFDDLPNITPMVNNNGMSCAFTVNSMVTRSEINKLCLKMDKPSIIMFDNIIESFPNWSPRNV